MTDAQKKRFRRSGRSPDAAPPALQFYLDDFFSDEHVLVMTNGAIGCYLKLLRCQWKKGSIPDDSKELAVLVGETHREFLKLWPSIRRCYVEAGPGKLQNKRMERERSLQKEYRDKKTGAGKRGAERRWHSDGTAIAEAQHKDGPASAGGTYVPPSCAPGSATSPGGGARAPVAAVADGDDGRCPSCGSLVPPSFGFDVESAEFCPRHPTKPVRGFIVTRCPCGHVRSRGEAQESRDCLLCVADRVPAPKSRIAGLS